MDQRPSTRSRYVLIYLRSYYTHLYKGHIANSIVRKVQSTGGILSHTDLEDYGVKVQPALEGSYRNRRIMTTHTPTSGPGKVVSDMGVSVDSSTISAASHTEYIREF